MRIGIFLRGHQEDIRQKNDFSSEMEKITIDVELMRTKISRESGVEDVDWC